MTQGLRVLVLAGLAAGCQSSEQYKKDPKLQIPVTNQRPITPNAGRPAAATTNPNLTIPARTTAPIVQNPAAASPETIVMPQQQSGINSAPISAPTIPRTSLPPVETVRPVTGQALPPAPPSPPEIGGTVTPPSSNPIIPPPGMN